MKKVYIQPTTEYVRSLSGQFILDGDDWGTLSGSGTHIIGGGSLPARRGWDSPSGL